MRRFAGIAAAALLLAGAAQAGVVKSTKAQIGFKGFGTFSMTSEESLSGLKKVSDAQNDFKGKGLLGGLAAKTILRSGHVGEILDLTASTDTRIDHKRKEFTTAPIQSLQKEASGSGQGREKDQPAETQESDVKITKSEFKVRDTGETKDINGFGCRRYEATWLAEWENVRTKQTGTNTMTTDVWTTPFTGDLKKALQEESGFAKAYLKAIGLDADKMQQDVLGLSWMSMLAAMNPGRGGAMTPESQQTARELAKIQGYSVVIDGKYVMTTQGGEPESQGERPGLGGLLGKLGKKKAASESAEPEPSLSYYVETVSIAVRDVDAAAFEPPAGYKDKSKR